MEDHQHPVSVYWMSNDATRQMISTLTVANFAPVLCRILDLFVASLAEFELRGQDDWIAVALQPLTVPMLSHADNMLGFSDVKEPLIRKSSRILPTRYLGCTSTCLVSTIWCSCH